MLCCVFWLVSPKCLGGKCLGGKFLHRVNASALASTRMVRYAISSTPFWWHVRCDCSVLLFVIMWHWHPLWFGSLLDSPAPFVMMQAPWFAWWSGVAVLNFCGSGHLRVGVSFVVFLFRVCHCSPSIIRCPSFWSLSFCHLASSRSYCLTALALVIILVCGKGDVVIIVINVVVSLGRNLCLLHHTLLCAHPKNKREPSRCVLRDC